MEFQILRRVNLDKQQLCQRILLFPRRIAEGCGEIALGVIVDQQDLFIFGCEGGCEIQGGSCLANAALLVSDCDSMHTHF